MSKKIVVLGAGRVGKVIAGDLSRDFDVTSADVSAAALEKLAARFPVKTRVTDLGDAKAVGAAIADAELVVCAVPGFMGFQTLKTILENGKNVVDISFFAEDALELDALAKEKGVIATVDCGLAPGNSDFIAGYYADKMQIDDFEFLVGGLHFGRTGPNGYLPTFSPVDVWEEYIRPARYVRDNKVITMPALSEPEIVEYNVGGHHLVLEAFNTDGLRSLITTMKGRIPNMKEKTLRYPGHIAYIEELKRTGKPWIPDTWKPGDDETEYTLLRINLTGKMNGTPKKISYTLFAGYDRENQFSSMSRTTGMTCTGVVRCVLDGKFTRKGISPPSYIGEAPGCLESIFAHLKARGIIFEKEES